MALVIVVPQHSLLQSGELVEPFGQIKHKYRAVAARIDSRIGPLEHETSALHQLVPRQFAGSDHFYVIVEAALCAVHDHRSRTQDWQVPASPIVIGRAHDEFHNVCVGADIHVWLQLARGDAVGQQHRRLARDVERIPGGSRESGPDLTTNYLFHCACESHLQYFAVFRLGTARSGQPAGNDPAYRQ